MPTADDIFHNGILMIYTHKHDSILQRIFDETALHKNSYAVLRDLEIEFGISGQALRGILEDLKDEGLIHEDIDGVWISPAGVHECRGRWA
ncbi:MAG: hypothetical protein ACRCUT_08120 [Spirochaetota bacterium]